jgi:hypothetical protein
LLDLIQWPAMVVTVAAAWFVASRDQRRRRVGFWVFLLSNVMWVIWGVYAHAYALVVLQVCLAAMNIRGERRNTARGELGVGENRPEGGLQENGQPPRNGRWWIRSHFTQENPMGTQNQPPNSPRQPSGTRQPGGSGQNEQQRDPKRTKAKDTGNVPRSDDDLMDEENQGTREDGAGSNARKE